MESIEFFNLNHPESQFDVSSQTSANANANANSTQCKEVRLSGRHCKSITSRLVSHGAKLSG